jgi:hypothetical protein
VEVAEVVEVEAMVAVQQMQKGWEAERQRKGQGMNVSLSQVV